ncbi:RibD family protein [Flaviflagellibacter deserti]|uniref:RibD family protein n=1 Tax=Flaviflagellibacter deserti TaxID=2267266 RepID=A0ABV9YX87_9HYPH
MNRHLAPDADISTAYEIAALRDLETDVLPLYWPLASASKEESFVVGQVGQSLDGRVATSSGDARNVSGKAGMQHLHRLRALSDAVIVGAGTVLHDDPRLTVREVEGAHPVRVIVDPHGRVPDTARVFADDGTRRITIQSCDAKRPEGIDVIRLDAANGTIDPVAILAALAERGLTRVLVEGGARTLGPFLLAGAMNRLLITLSPLIIGDGPSGLALPPVPHLRDCLRPRTTFYDLGGEIVIDCAFHHHEAGEANRS